MPYGSSFEQVIDAGASIFSRDGNDNTKEMPINGARQWRMVLQTCSIDAPLGILIGLEVDDEAQRRWKRSNGQAHDRQLWDRNGAFCKAWLAQGAGVQYWRSRTGDRDNEVLTTQ